MKLGHKGFKDSPYHQRHIERPWKNLFPSLYCFCFSIRTMRKISYLLGQKKTMNRQRNFYYINQKLSSMNIRGTVSLKVSLREKNYILLALPLTKSKHPKALWECFPSWYIPRCHAFWVVFFFVCFVLWGFLGFFWVFFKHREVHQISPQLTKLTVPHIFLHYLNIICFCTARNVLKESVISHG